MDAFDLGDDGYQIGFVDGSNDVDGAVAQRCDRQFGGFVELDLDAVEVREARSVVTRPAVLRIRNKRDDIAGCAAEHERPGRFPRLGQPGFEERVDIHLVSRHQLGKKTCQIECGSVERELHRCAVDGKRTGNDAIESGDDVGVNHLVMRLDNLVGADEIGP